MLVEYKIINIEVSSIKITFFAFYLRDDLPDASAVNLMLRWNGVELLNFFWDAVGLRFYQRKMRIKMYEKDTSLFMFSE